MSYESVPRWIREITEHFKTQKMCNETVAQFPYALRYVRDHLKTEEMCNEALEVDPWSLYYVPDHLKTQTMCDKAVKDDPSSLQFVPDWFVEQGRIDVWYDDEYWYHHDEMIEWHDEYKKRKAQKASIKKELMHIAWHPSRRKKRRWK